MSNLDIFRDEYLPNAQGATVSFAGWKKNYPAEHTAWIAYRDEVLAGNLPQPPTMTSKYGKALAAAGQMAERDDMKVTVSTSGGTMNLTGTVTVTATPAPVSSVTSVKFYVNSVLKSTDTSSPYTYAWDTTLVNPGAYELKAEALYPRNKKATGKLDVTVLNQQEPPPPPPPPPISAEPVNTALPAISGTATEGQSLSVSTGSWTNSPTSYTRQWNRCDAAGANCVLIASATGMSYVLTDSDVGATIRCSVTAFNSVGASAAVQTAQTAVVAALTPAIPVLVTAPVITGTPTEGQTLIISSGSWTNSPTSYAHQWRRCDSPTSTDGLDISGEQETTYAVVTADVGKTMRSWTTATNATGDSIPVISAATAVVTALPAPPPPPPPAGLGVDPATMFATGGTILREDTSAVSDALTGLWGELNAGTYPTVNTSRLTYVTTGGDTHLKANGVAQGNTAHRRMTVQDGDNWWGERTEIGRNEWRNGENAPGQTSGTFALYREGEHKITFFSQRYGAGFTSSVGSWQTVFQIKQTQPYAGNGPVNTAPALELQIYGGQLRLHSFWNSIWTTPAPPLNTWIRYALDVTYSKDPSKGKIQVFVDTNNDGVANVVSPVFTMRTLAYATTAGSGFNVNDPILGHARIGIYHSDTAYGTTVVDVDNVQVVG